MRRFHVQSLGLAVVAAGLLVFGRGTALADDAPPPPPPSPPPAAAPTPALVPAPSDSPPASATGNGVVVPPAATPGFVNGRPLPPEPPPPEADIPQWDKNWRDRDVGLGPPLPPPDPFLPRDILWRHDTREVSADGRLKPVKRVPQWVDVVNRDEIREWRPLDLGDFARRQPNVIVGDAGSPFLAIPTIRGFGGDRVKIMTDGVWPTTQALGFHGSSLSLWDPESTQRMEIYHGPGAYLRAIDAPGGVINIVPRRPRRHGCWTADFGVASAYASATNTFRQRAESDFGADRVAALVGATWTTVGNRDLGNGTTLEPSGYETVAADAAVDYFLDNQSTIGVTAQYKKAYDVDAPTGTQSSAVQPEYERTFLAITLSSFDVGPVFHGHRMSIAIDTFFQEQDDAFSTQTSGLGTQDDVDRFDLHLEGSLYLAPCHDTWAELTVSYAHLNRTETLLCTGPGPVFPKVGDDRGLAFADLGLCDTVVQSYEAEEWVVTGLVEDQMHDECWDKHVGVRVDWYHYEDGRTGETQNQFLFGASGGLARHFTRSVTGFANASFGWRRPTIHERTANTVLDGKTILGNDDLDPEFHANAEVGVKSSWRNRASLQAALFAHYTDDYISPVDLFPPAANQAILENQGSSFLYGFEWTGAIRPSTTIEGWELFASAGLTLSTDTDLIPNMPVTWRTGTRYSVPQPKGYRVRRWYGEIAFHGATDSSEGPRGGDAYATAEALVGTGIHLGGYKAGWLNVGVTNLFDTSYTPPGAVLPAAGLSLIASLEIKL